MLPGRVLGPEPGPEAEWGPVGPELEAEAGRAAAAAAASLGLTPPPRAATAAARFSFFTSLADLPPSVGAAPSGLGGFGCFGCLGVFVDCVAVDVDARGCSDMLFECVLCRDARAEVVQLCVESRVIHFASEVFT